jgi:hypothetical protein
VYRMPENHVILLQRYSLQRAICKQCTVFLAVAILLIGALGRLAAINLLWAAAPLLLLGLAEAGYAAQERRCAELLSRGKGQDESLTLLTAAGEVGFVRTVMAALSFSIWPFYLGLIGIVVAGSRAFPAPGGDNAPIAADVASVSAQPKLQMPPGPVSVPIQAPQLAQHQGQSPLMTLSKPAGGPNLPHLPPMNTTIVRNGPSISQPPTPPVNPHANPTFQKTAPTAVTPFPAGPNALAPSGKN